MFLVKTVAKNVSADPDFVAHGQVRYEVYVEEKKWVPAAGLPDHRETDPLDEIAKCAVAYDALAEGEPAGAIRNIPRNGTPLPVEDHFGVEVDPERKAIEVSRLAIPRSKRGSLVIHGLFKWVVQEALSDGVEDLYAIVEQGLLETLNGFGFPFVALTPPTQYFDGLTMAAHCRADRLIAGVEEQDELRHRRPLAPFFRAPASGSIYVDKETIYDVQS